MANYHIPTAQDLRLLMQPNINLYSKVELLNYEYKIEQNLEGYLISDDLTISSESGVRRTYTMTVSLIDETFRIAKDSTIWFNRTVRPYVGVYDIQEDEIVWYLMGTFVVTDNSVQFDASTHSMTINFSDLMCRYNGERGGMLTVEADNTVIVSGVESIVGTLHISNYKILEGTTVYDALKETLALLAIDINNCEIEDPNEDIPYDLEFGIGSTPYDILNEITELYPGYEMFFDIDGKFIWRSKPTCFSDYVVLDDDYLSRITISESSTNSLSGIYNHTIIYGDIIEPDFYSNQVTSEGRIYQATVDQYTSYENYDKVALVFPATCKNYPYLNINSLGNIPITDSAGDPLMRGSLLADTTYVFRFLKINPKYKDDEHPELHPCFYLMGQYQPYGEYAEMDVNCPFSVPNVGEYLTQVIEMDTIYSDDLALRRAEYETYQKCKLTDSLTLTTLPIYWLDVNQKISYQTSEADFEEQYIINSISCSSSDSQMTITLAKFYEDETVVYSKKHANDVVRTVSDNDITIYHRDLNTGFEEGYGCKGLQGYTSHTPGRGILIQSSTIKMNVQIPRTATGTYVSGYTYKVSQTIQYRTAYVQKDSTTGKWSQPIVYDTETTEVKTITTDATGAIKKTESIGTDTIKQSVIDTTDFYRIADVQRANIIEMAEEDRETKIQADQEAINE